MEAKYILHFLFLLFPLTNAYSQTCPEKESIDNCDCRNHPNNVIQVDCHGAYSVKEYVSALRKSVDLRSNIQLNIYGIRKPNNISTKTFEGFHISRLEINTCNISGWSDEPHGPAFVGLENSLESLHIKNSIKRIQKPWPLWMTANPEFTIGHLRKLKEFEMYENDLYNFCSDWFGDGLEDTLEIIKLERNNIFHVCPEVFKNFRKLKYVNLGWNTIFYTALSRNMFPNPAMYLEEIDFHDNRISKLPEDFFDNMPALRIVSFTGNEIQSLPERTWKPVWSQLFLLEFKVRPLGCYEDEMKWMFKIRRPEHISADCHHPEEMEGKTLEQIIDERQNNN